jgi:hypothetical protein
MRKKYTIIKSQEQFKNKKKIKTPNQTRKIKET